MSQSIPRRQFLTVAVSGACFVELSTSAHAEIQRKRVRVNQAARGDFNNYGQDSERFQGRLVTDRADEDQVVLNLENWRLEYRDVEEKLPGAGIAVPAANSAFGTNRNLAYTQVVNGVRRATLPSIHTRLETGAVPQLVRRKTFMPSDLFLDVGFVHLDQVALAIYETGHIQCSGRIAHNGGLNQELKGAKVTIQVRAYSEPARSNFPPPNGPILGSWEQLRWVSAKAPSEEILLVNTDCDANIRLKYDEISHMSVNLVYWRSR
jgi:hypothetical protein